MWLDALAMTELAINNAVQDSTGMSPAKVVFGQRVVLPIDCLDGLNNNEAAQTAVVNW